jgi:Mce-associated membrane protein
VTTNGTGDLTDADDTDAETVTDESADEAAQNDDSAIAPETESEGGGVAVRRSPRIVLALGAILLVAALVASAGVAAWLYFEQYRPDQATDAAASNVALDAAKNGTVALLSYSPESLDKDFAAAKSHLTGDFLSYYTQFTEQIVTPAAKQKSVKTTAAVVRAAVAELQPDSAEVLVFINQNTVSKENPDGSFAASAVKVGLKKINGAWLIASFDPV